MTPRGVDLTPQLIDQNGRKTYANPPGAVAEATVNAFKSLGFDVAFVNAERGIIKSGRKVVSQQAMSLGGSAKLYVVEFQFTAEIISSSKGTDLRLTPSRFENQVDVSSAPGAWYLDNPGGLKEHWNAVFSEVDLQLGPAPQPQADHPI